MSAIGVFHQLSQPMLECRHAQRPASLVLLLFSVGLSVLGFFVAQKPARMYRFFTFGIQPEKQFFVGFAESSAGSLQFSVLSEC